MALFGLNNNTSKVVKLGNRNDYCYLCALEIKGKDERDYNKQFYDLKGKHEGKPVLKIKRGGTETVMCMKCLNEIVKQHTEQEE